MKAIVSYITTYIFLLEYLIIFLISFLIELPRFYLGNIKSYRMPNIVLVVLNFNSKRMVKHKNIPTEFVHMLGINMYFSTLTLTLLMLNLCSNALYGNDVLLRWCCFYIEGKISEFSHFFAFLCFKCTLLHKLWLHTGRKGAFQMFIICQPINPYVVV